MDDVSPLARYLVPLRRWWAVMAGALVVGLAVAWVTLPEPPREPTAEEIAEGDLTFRATNLVLRNEQSPSAASFDLVLLLARQGELAHRVAERMEGAVSTLDVDAVELEADRDVGTMAIRVLHQDPDVAVELATVYAEELNALLHERAQGQTDRELERARERQAAVEARIQSVEEELAGLPPEDLDRRLVEAELDALIEEYGRLGAQAQALEARRIEDDPAFETLQPPVAVSAQLPEEVPTLAPPEEPLARFALAVVLALLGGFAVVMAIDRLDTRIRTRRDAEEAFGLPVVAELPHRSRKQRELHPLPVTSDPDGATAEVLRTLRLAVTMSPIWRLAGQAPAHDGAPVGTVAPVSDHDPPRTLVVTSPLTGDGKTNVVAGLATSFAESGHRVLVIDCDFRRPAVPDLLGAEEGRGLRDMRNPEEEPLKDLVVSTKVEGVTLVRSGKPGIAPAWFLTHAKLMIEQATELADVVLFDTGPLPLTNEASTLVPVADSSLVVIRGSKLTRERARDTVERLARVGASVAGVVLVGAERSPRYGYYETKPEPDTESAAKVVW
jgi:capsular exopolysaccharide synthesis family protein